MLKGPIIDLLTIRKSLTQIWSEHRPLLVWHFETAPRTLMKAQPRLFTKVTGAQSVVEVMTFPEVKIYSNNYILNVICDLSSHA